VRWWPDEEITHSDRNRTPWHRSSRTYFRAISTGSNNNDLEPNRARLRARCCRVRSKRLARGNNPKLREQVLQHKCTQRNHGGGCKINSPWSRALISTRSLIWVTTPEPPLFWEKVEERVSRNHPPRHSLTEENFRCGRFLQSEPAMNRHPSNRWDTRMLSDFPKLSMSWVGRYPSCTTNIEKALSTVWSRYPEVALISSMNWVEIWSEHLLILQGGNKIQVMDVQLAKDLRHVESHQIREDYFYIKMSLLKVSKPYLAQWDIFHTFLRGQWNWHLAE